MSQEFFHPETSSNTYATVILPIAVPKPYTYIIPEEMVSFAKVGVRVEVQFGKNRLYSALIFSIENEAPENYTPKPLLSIIDLNPIVNETHLKFWNWIANYYNCTMGEVMNAALPYGLKLNSETCIIASPFFDDNYEGLSHKEYLIAEALRIQHELSLDKVQKILNQKTVYPLIQKLLDKKLIYIKEDLVTKYKPKTVGCVKFNEPYASNSELLDEAFSKLSKSNRQVEALMAYIQLSRNQKHVTKRSICDLAKVTNTVIKAIEKKEVLVSYDREVSRLKQYDETLDDFKELAPQQVEACHEIKELFKEKDVVLLHGVTGSGKTRVYTELIKEALERNEQVLYLLPEIALTAQIISRLQKVFGDKIAVYHSKLNNNERVELWRSALIDRPIILGARSSLLLPFKNLKLIIVDEEHDGSFKQFDPAPRYNARDSAIVLAKMFGAKVVLGTATPAVETHFNTSRGKYGLVKMTERFGGLQLPEIIIVDAKDEYRKKKMQSHFTSVLLHELKAALERGEQAILFQNRRGYAPTLTCKSCAWNVQCVHCDVSLTFHKFSNDLRCHYCGYKAVIPKTCPACGDVSLHMRGFGTEKIEDELKIYVPDAKIARMDYDTVKSKNAHATIINDFEEKRVNILVGTQMVTKGLDFENVGLVGVLSADHLLQFPEFRASERAFQLMTQVSGRAGRKHKRGKVIIQAFKTDHPVIQEVLHNNYEHFIARELEERNAFQYPPYVRLIQISLKHKKPEILNEGAKIFSKYIKSKLGDRVHGPAIPGVPRVRNLYILDFMLKLEKKADLLKYCKHAIQEASIEMHANKGLSTIRVSVNVDP